MCRNVESSFVRKVGQSKSLKLSNVSTSPTSQPGTLKCSRLVTNDFGSLMILDEKIFHLKLAEDGNGVGQTGETDKTLKLVFILAVGKSCHNVMVDKVLVT